MAKSTVHLFGVGATAKPRAHTHTSGQDEEQQIRCCLQPGSRDTQMSHVSFMPSSNLWTANLCKYTFKHCLKYLMVLQ